MKKLILVVAAIIVVAGLLFYANSAGLFQDVSKYAYTDEGENLTDAFTDTRLVVSDWPSDGVITRGTPHEFRFYYQTLDMWITHAESIASDGTNPSIYYELHRDSVTGALNAQGSMPSDYCVTHPTFSLVWGTSANIPAHYFLKVWTAGEGSYEDQSAVFEFEVV